MERSEKSNKWVDRRMFLMLKVGEGFCFDTSQHEKNSDNKKNIKKQQIAVYI